MSSKFVTSMQPSTVNSTQGGQTATVIQVNPKSSSGSHTIIQQNGQHLILGKLVSADQSASDSANTAETITLQSNGQSVYPVQYIEAGQEPTVYTTSNNGQIEYIEINSGKPITKLLASTKSDNGQYQDYSPSIYAGSGATYYQASTGQVSGTGGTTVQGLHGRLVTHQGNTYLLPQIDNDNSQMPHTTRASPVTVQWLIDNYETAEGVSLPRSTLYSHYLRHCHEQKIEPMNPASFGKLIRSVFLGLRTRRLGTRGNSKYHYYGIRIKPNSHLNQFVEDQTFAMRHYPHYHKQSIEADYYSGRFKSVKYDSEGRSTTTSGPMANNAGPGASNATSSGGISGGTTTTTTLGEDPSKHQQFLGDASSALPNLGEICMSAGLGASVAVSATGAAALATMSRAPTISDKMNLPMGIVEDDISIFTKLYSDHCEEILNSVVNLSFSHLEAIWQNFWRTGPSQDPDLERRLPQDKLYQLCRMENVRSFIRLSDHTFYQSLVEVLIPDVLRPIPSTLTQGIRNFAKSLEGWMKSATRDLEPELSKLKTSAVSALAQTLRRYTSLNHLAQAARAVLLNTNQINQMLADLNRVDFANVQEQASWVCHCDDDTVAQLQQDFKKILQQQTSLEEWAAWLDDVVTSVLRPKEGLPDFSRAARQFILKWSFYSSMVIRDLTLRSAASFGSFHLIRLLYDEYIYYLVEHKVATHEGLTPVAVMGELSKCEANEDVDEGEDSRNMSLAETTNPEDNNSMMIEGEVGTTGSGGYSSYILESDTSSVSMLPTVSDGSNSLVTVVSSKTAPSSLSGENITLVKRSNSEVGASTMAFPGVSGVVGSTHCESLSASSIENGSPPPVTSSYNLFTRKTVRVTTGDENEASHSHHTGDSSSGQQQPLSKRLKTE